MPRHTHPPAQAKHSRAHTREQSARWARRRWQQAKRRYGRPGDLHPEIARRQPDHPDAWWPFTLSANELSSRNPFTLCSCGICSYLPQARRARRAREDRAWRADWDGCDPADGLLAGRRIADQLPRADQGW